MAGSRLLPSAPTRAAGDDTIPDMLPNTVRTNQLPVLIVVAAIMIFVGMQVVQHLHVTPPQLALIWVCYAAGVLAIWLVRRTNSRRVLIASECVALITGTTLALSPANALGSLLIEAVAFMAIFRLPQRWMLPILTINTAVFAFVEAIYFFFITHNANALTNFGLQLVFFALLAWIPFSMRSRALVIQELEATQAQLRAEMARTADLAAARERARIARDIHDVLAHSLTVLSIQAQAARQIVAQKPEQAAAMLDDIAAVLRESLSESRRVVGLLREAGAPGQDESTLAVRLNELAERFGERTGIRCAFHEHGTPLATTGECDEALRFALQEALTNAYRHGGAQHVWADLTWEATGVALTVRDDGAGQATGPSVGGGNGLRGMRERAETLGGTLSAGPHEDQGFVIKLALPLTSGAAS